MKLNENVIAQIYQHALDDYPDECCGVVTGDEKNQSVHRFENIQNRLHSEDPDGHPRDARTAYAIDRKEFDRTVSAALERRENIIALYHSHIDHDAYFSETDVEAQTVFGEPEFPDALHVVVSVRQGQIKEIKYFKWDKSKKNFTGIAGPA